MTKTVHACSAVRCCCLCLLGCGASGPNGLQCEKRFTLECICHLTGRTASYAASAHGYHDQAGAATELLLVPQALVLLLLMLGQSLQIC